MEKLFETQQKAAQQVLHTLESTPKGSVVFLEGLRGTGKSLVIDTIKDEFLGERQ